MILRTLKEVLMRMSKGVVIAAVLMIGIGLFSRGMEAQATDPSDQMVGTWQLDAAKSKFSPGPAPKSIVLKVEQSDQGIKATSDAELPDGKKTHTEFTAAYDGKDYPLTGSPIADTVSLKMDGKTRIRTDKKGGKVVMTYTSTLSSDGKTFTVRQKGTNEKGEAVNNTVVFVKR
jgi:hypothetical protein